jgi:hypothetical protein
MPLISTSLDETPEERFALYRQHRVAHSVLLLPFDSLSRLQQQAAIDLAAQWGRELAEVDTVRRDLAHSGPDESERQLVGLWLLRLLHGPVHLLDAQYWIEEGQRWKEGEGTDRRLIAFRDAWHQVLPSQGPVPAAGPSCGCPTCKERYRKRKGKRR